MSRNGDAQRADTIRAKRRRGCKLNDIDRRWLEQYEVAVRERQHQPAPPPTTAPERILAAVIERYSVSRDRLLYMGRGEMEVELARAVAVLAMRSVGASFAVAGAAINRVPTSIAHTARLHAHRPFVRREVAAVLRAAGACPPARKGQVVEVPVMVVVGGPLWRDLDRQSEAEEYGEATLHRVTGPDSLAAE